MSAPDAPNTTKSGAAKGKRRAASVKLASRKAATAVRDLAPKLKAVTAFPWKEIENGLAAIRSFTLTVLLFVALVAVIGFTIAELRRDVVVIDPIRLPASLKSMGYSEEVAALRLWDAVVEVNETTPTIKDRISLLPASQRVDFDAPGAGMSMQTIVRMLRRFLDLEETRIAGEFICADPDCAAENLALRLRVFRNDRMKLIHMPTIEAAVGKDAGTDDVNRYFTATALALLSELDPYLVAFHLYQSDKAASEREALKLIGPTHPQRKWALNLLGLIAADRGDLPAALDWYERAIAEDQDFAIAYLNWGNTLLDSGNPDDAIEKISRSVEIDDKFWLAYVGWGNALAKKRQLDDAFVKYAKAAELAPEVAEIQIQWGHALFNGGKLDQAIEKFSLASELDPADAVAVFNWGIALSAKGKHDDAVKQYIRATELDPKDSVAFVKWGTALQAQGNLAGATEKFTRATELDPQNAVAFNSLGAALGNLGKIDSAAESFARATEIDPNFRDAHLNKAYALQMLKRNAQAADALEAYLDLDPEDGDADLIRAQIIELRAQAD